MRKPINSYFKQEQEKNPTTTTEKPDERRRKVSDRRSLLSSEDSKPRQKPVAKGIVITSTADAEPPRDSRIKCPSCGRLITPRLVTYGGRPSRSYCPFCGALVKDFTTKCFIATAVYGDPLHPAVIALRRFRNEALLTNLPGRLLVKVYYRLSPPVAEFAKRHPAVGRVVKPLLDSLAAHYG